MFHRVEEIQVVWKNPGVVALCVGLVDGMKSQTTSWNPGVEKAPLSFLVLGTVRGHVVTETERQEE